MIKCWAVCGRILFCRVRCGQTRHEPDRDPVLRGVLAENVEQEKGGAAKEQRVIDNQQVNPRHTC